MKAMKVLLKLSDISVLHDYAFDNSINFETMCQEHTLTKTACENSCEGYGYEIEQAEVYVDTGVKILIAVVIGALILGGLYALFDDTVMPTVTEKIEELFDYAG